MLTCSMRNNILFLLAFFMASATALHAQWQSFVRLTYNSDSSYTGLNCAPSVAASGDTVHAIWRDLRDGNFEIYYKRSTNGGASWGPDTRLTTNPANSVYPALAIADSIVHIVWKDDRDGKNELYYIRSTNYGQSWGTETRLTSDSAGIVCSATSIAVVDSVVHIVWDDYRDSTSRVYYMRSTNCGINWGREVGLSDRYVEAYSSTIAASASGVHVAWFDFRNVHSEVYYKRSTDAGSNWGADTRVTPSNSTKWSLWPSIAASDSSVHLVWNDNDDNGNTDVCYKFSSDNGTTWGQYTKLTSGLTDSPFPSVASNGPVAYVTWEDNRDGNYEIYCKQTADGGANWDPDERLTDNTSQSEGAAVAMSGSKVHIVWTDYRDGNSEIYYVRCLNVVPVVMVFFEASFSEQWSSVLLRCRTASETNHHGFEIERMTKVDDVQIGDHWCRIGFMPGGGTTASGREYSFVDRQVHANRSYVYRLKQIDTDGSSSYSAHVEVSTTTATAFDIGMSYPNPVFLSGENATVAFSIPRSMRVTLSVADEYGRDVAVLLDERKDRGSYQTLFDPSLLPSGNYYFVLRSGSALKTRRFVVVR